MTGSEEYDERKLLLLKQKSVWGASLQISAVFEWATQKGHFFWLQSAFMEDTQDWVKSLFWQFWAQSGKFYQQT